MFEFNAINIDQSVEISTKKPTIKIAGLTTRQSQVLILLGEGLCNRDIAASLDLSENTVKVHLTAVFKVLNVHNRTKAVLALQRLLSDTE